MEALEERDPDRHVCLFTVYDCDDSREMHEVSGIVSICGINQDGRVQTISLMTLTDEAM